MRFLPLLLAACHGPIGGYCADLKDCIDADRGACVDSLERDEEASRDAGCSAEWKDWSRCLAQESECNGALYSPPGDSCGDELFAWSACMDPMFGG